MIDDTEYEKTLNKLSDIKLFKEDFAFNMQEAIISELNKFHKIIENQKFAYIGKLYLDRYREVLKDVVKEVNDINSDHIDDMFYSAEQDLKRTIEEYESHEQAVFEKEHSIGSRQ